MRTALLIWILSTVLVVLGIGCSGCHRKSTVKVLDTEAPDFPFTFVDQRGSIVFIDPEFYNQQNLEKLFLWHYKKHLNTQGAPTMLVFTDKQLMYAYIEENKKPMGWEPPPPELRTPSPFLTPKHTRNVLFDAEFSQVPSESMLLKEESYSSSGFNVVYFFAPDLTQPRVRKTVVLRGATWTQGKYDVELKELNWHTGQITVTAYNLYNTVPAGRYYTFGFKTKYQSFRGPAEKTRVIFNFRQEKAVPPPIDQVKIINESVAYVNMGWMYSVSLDSGQTWHWWDAERELPEWKCCDPGLIKDVSVSENGNGVMTLRLDPNKPENRVYLRTTDFGQHWLKD